MERLQAEGRFPDRRGGGRACRGGADDEPQPQIDMEMEVEHQMEDDVEAKKEVGYDDDEH